MTDDPIKRFNLSEAQPHRAFKLSNDLAPVVKTKDNAQPVIPPPLLVFLPQPMLAPPGMMGSRLAKEAAEWMAKRPPEPERKPFMPLVSGRDKYRGQDR